VKSSADPNFKAKLARNPANKIREILEIKSATQEEYKAISNARRASPFLAKGYPSSTVHDAAGVPGVLIKIAVIDPP
jgi:hypothetical protein